MIRIDKVNTCIIVVTFNPKDDFCNNLHRCLEIVDKVVIVDNHSNRDMEDFISVNDAHRVTLIKSNENKGIAWALNQGLHWAMENGFVYALTFDQDSLPVFNILELYNSVLEKYPSIGLLGSSFTDKQSSVSCVHVENKLSIITSGTLHKLSVLSIVGMYDESFFIDSVDFDFALRVRSYGYAVLRVKEPLLCHHLGEPLSKWGIQTTNHSAFRRYYMARNHVTLTKKYWRKFPLWILKKNFSFGIEFLKLIIADDNKIEKIHQIKLGISDGFKM